MATSELIAPLPRVTLANGMTIAFEAISPTTGLAVTGVKVSLVAIYGDDTDDQAEAGAPLDVGPYMLVPGPNS